ncbi:uncharacterized protein Bfra_007885ia [Botrytis fragariae]|uniref:Uncharacterized protein n=1 Tax=Botrytis fragariae TaxID=1964551 RepID=A0A8H6AQ95_9HELO|nr:uncharacterized protein Bfra_007885ia [Botrytis fragariae]KAF5871370.1 hypothetical protein Bfra_007885ia [Botrytis fragariae]
MSEAPHADPSTRGFTTLSFCGCLELPEPVFNADNNAVLKMSPVTPTKYSFDGYNVVFNTSPITPTDYSACDYHGSETPIQFSLADRPIWSIFPATGPFVLPFDVQKLLVLWLSAGILVTLVGNANIPLLKMSETCQDIISLVCTHTQVKKIPDIAIVARKEGEEPCPNPLTTKNGGSESQCSYATT